MGHTAEKTQVATRIDSDLLRELDELCEQERRPRSFLLEEALKKLLAKDHNESSKAGVV